jgi:hypothetical protein
MSPCGLPIFPRHCLADAHTDFKPLDVASCGRWRKSFQIAGHADLMNAKNSPGARVDLFFDQGRIGL